MVEKYGPENRGISVFFFLYEDKALGVKFAHQWTAEEFKSFIESKGRKIIASEIVSGRIDLTYAECVRMNN